MCHLITSDRSLPPGHHPIGQVLIELLPEFREDRPARSHKPPEIARQRPTRCLVPLLEILPTADAVLLRRAQGDDTIVVRLRVHVRLRANVGGVL